MINISECYIAAQGEGITTGLITLFVRVSECNFAKEGHPCTYCDTSYAWEKSDSDKVVDVKGLLKLIQTESKGLREVCITGGEPLSNPEVCEVIDQLAPKMYHVTVETNGSYEVWKESRISWSLDIKCPSSGNSEHNCFVSLCKMDRNDQVKFVIGDWADFEYARGHAITLRRTNVIFQPVYGKLKHAELIDWVKGDKELVNYVRVGMQCHKVWYPEAKRGV